MTNNFNYSFIKTFIEMITKMKFRKLANLKTWIVILLAVSLFTITSCNQKKLTKSSVSRVNTEQKKLTKSPISRVNTEQTQEKVYQEVEQMPEFPGGNAELRNFLMHSVRYPIDAMKNKIQGKVFVSFVVGKDGFVKDAKVARGADPLLDAEALRVVKSFPQWKPGKEKGKDVAVEFTIPIDFKLQ
jgi:TonB family protein